MCDNDSFLYIPLFYPSVLGEQGARGPVELCLLRQPEPEAHHEGALNLAKVNVCKRQ